MLKLQQRVEAVARDAAVKADDDALVFKIDRRDDADVAVEDAGTGGAVILRAPHDVVVILYLHHAVALAEDDVAEGFLRLVLRRRVQRRLKVPVEVDGAKLALPRRREDLYVLGRDMHLVRQARGTQLRYSLDRACRL